MNLRERALATLKGMYPGTFAMAMATGIVAIALKRLGYSEPAQVLFTFNLVLLPFLWLLLISRVAIFPREVLADIGDHWRGAGFFTVPAACGVFGSQWLEFGGRGDVGTAIWWLAFGCWIIVTLLFFCSMIVGENQVDIHYAINGAWLTSVVATQSLSVLASALAAKGIIDRQLGFYTAACFAGGGALLYLMLIASIFYRLVVHPVRAKDFSAPYWVNMGAAMITALAFSRASMIADFETRVPLKLMGVVFWSFGVWWIPMLVALGIWRHGYKKLPLVYDPRLWSLVFPLGMFTACTHTLSVVWKWDGFLKVAGVAVWVAAGAWLLMSIGLARTAWRWFLGKA